MPIAGSFLSKQFAEAVDSLVKSMLDCASQDGEYVVSVACLHDDTYTIWLEGVPYGQQTRLTISPGPNVVFESTTHRLASVTIGSQKLLLPLVPSILYAILAYAE